MDAAYNDVPQWDYKELVTVFSGGKDGDSRKYTIKTKEEADKLLSDKDFNERKGMRFVEVYMPKKDAPRSLMLTAEASAKVNAAQAEEA